MFKLLLLLGLFSSKYSIGDVLYEKISECYILIEDVKDEYYYTSVTCPMGWIDEKRLIEDLDNDKNVEKL